MKKLQIITLVAGIIVMLSAIVLITIQHRRAIGFIFLCVGFISVINAFNINKNNKK